jgi:tryptophan synthase alpha chain
MKATKKMENSKLASKLENRFKNAIAGKGYVFLPYLAAGDPDWNTSTKIVRGLIDSGADSIEIGLPFTDPVADGPVLQRAFKRVLSHKFHIDRFFTFLETIKKENPDFPFIVMGYANLFYHMGFKKMFTKLVEYNVAAVIIPDIPFEEKNHWIEKEKLGPILEKLSWIDFITPTITPQRLKLITAKASGFLYFVSTKGVTGGAKFSLRPWKPIIQSIKNQTKVPVLAGFGIRNKENAKEAVNSVDGFIIGSRIHEIIEENLEKPFFMADKIKTELAVILPGNL